MKIVFFGTPLFATESLKRIYKEGIEIAAVVTAPDKTTPRPIYSDVKMFARSVCLPVLQPKNLKDPEFIEELRKLKADLFVVVAFRMLPEVVWSMPPLGTFNLHASLLPKYRGAAPIEWALINGETETGVTTFFIDSCIDTGRIIDRKVVPISPDDNSGTLHDRLMMEGAELVLSTIHDIEEGRVIPFEQDITGEKPCNAPKIFRDTRKIDWTKPAQEIHNFIRGFSPTPGAWSKIGLGNGTVSTIKIFSSQVLHSPIPSNQASIRLVVPCEDGVWLEIFELQLEGRKRMAAIEFLLGQRGINPRLF